jgi:predicted AAA+ superfamily ATPase
MEYVSRYADTELKNRLSNAGAVLIIGPKACGKTETALRVSASNVRLDVDERAAMEARIDPKRLLTGDAPRLLDEWQRLPILWDLVRRDVDDSGRDGMYILTGSAKPEETARLHSGAGRFTVMKMRPMSLAERAWSTGEVKLSSILNTEDIDSRTVTTSLEEIAEMILYGGWPGLLGKGLGRAIEYSRDYVTLTAEIDISEVSNKRRDPDNTLKLMQSIARNISTEASISAMAGDVRGGGAFKDETAADYLDALGRLMIVEDLPAWSPHIKSRAMLRQTPKRHFVDPSIACGALKLSKEKLLDDLGYFGFLFESLAIRDLRIYADTLGGKVFHYRDSYGLEADAIVELPDGEWFAVEVKLGMNMVDDAAKTLAALASAIDVKKTRPPNALVIVTGNGFAHRRADGIYVIPLLTLSA